MPDTSNFGDVIQQEPSLPIDNNQDEYVDLSLREGSERRLTFGITVWNEPIELLQNCLHHLRNCYPESRAFLITDGQDFSGYRSACAQHRVEYLPGERLKVLAAGAKWWDRFFRVADRSPSDYVFKLDPDTLLHRRFLYFPPYELFGTPEGAHRIQGGIQGFRASTVRRIRASNICLDPAYADASTWATERGVKEYVIRLGQISTDFVLAHIAARLSIRCGGWDEVHSLWSADQPFRSDVAATHPHKISK